MSYGFMSPTVPANHDGGEKTKRDGVKYEKRSDSAIVASSSSLVDVTPVVQAPCGMSSPQDTLEGE